MMREQAPNRLQNEKVSFNSRRDRKRQIDSYSAKVDDRKECQKCSGSEIKPDNDDRISLHADDDSELTGNMNNFLRTNMELEDGDSESGVKNLSQELDKDEKIGEEINKDLAL